MTLTGKTIGELTNLVNPTAGTLIPVESSGSTYNIDYSVIRPYKVYSALLTQTGTTAPVATVLENTLDGTPIWDYAGTGQYYATLTGAFTVDKTTVSITMSGTATVAQSNTNAIRYTNSLAGTEPDVIVISCFKADTGVGADNLFTKAFIEIRVYN